MYIQATFATSRSVPQSMAASRSRRPLAWPTLVPNPDPHKALFYATTRDGVTFTERARVSPIGRNAAHPQIAIASDGRVFVFWDEIVDAKRRVFASIAGREQPVFSPPSILDTKGTASYPVAAATREGMVVAWTEGDPASSTIVVRRLTTAR